MSATSFITLRKADAKLHDVASGVFHALSISEWEERDSSNYPPDGHYFTGYSENAEVTVYDGDDERTPDYPFRVSVEDAVDRLTAQVEGLRVHALLEPERLSRERMFDLLLGAAEQELRFSLAR